MAKSRLVSNDSTALASSHNLDIFHLSYVANRTNPRQLSLNFGEKAIQLLQPFGSSLLAALRCDSLLLFACEQGGIIPNQAAITKLFPVVIFVCDDNNKSRVVTDNEPNKNHKNLQSHNNQKMILARFTKYGNRYKSLPIKKDRIFGMHREIAEQMGFYDIYHFSKLFKKQFGLAPGKYRKDFTQAR